MNGFEGNLINLVNKILPQAKDKEQIANVLPWWIIVLNILSIILLITQATNDFGEYAAFYLVRLALSALMIFGASLMKKRALSGWRIVFYTIVVSLAINIIALNILGILFPCFFLYLFIQIREIYN